MSAEDKKTILLVEDEEFVAMVEKEILENFGYNVIMVSSGEKAMEIIGKTPAIDLVLMDINLGAGIDGTEAAVRILRHHDIPVVFLSSHTEPEIVEKTEKITSYGYVVKGSGPTVLQASIKMAFKLFAAKIKEMEKEAKMEAALAALVQQHDALSKLNQFSVELAMLSAEDDLESLIAKNLKEIAGAEMAVFSEYDPENRTTTIRNIEMEPGLLEKVVGLLGKKMEKIHSAVSAEMYREMTKEIIGTRKTLYEISLGAISRPVGASIQALLKVERFIGIAYLIDGKLYGTSILGMNKGQLDPPQPILESFSYLASVSLRRKQAVRQREAALASLRESELKFRVLVENINDVLYTLDAAGKFTYVSPVIERISGIKPGDIIGRNFSVFVHPDDLPVLIEKFRQTMGGAREAFEFRVFNGEQIHHVRTSSQRVLRDGVVTGLTGIMSDISQRKQEGELLRASEERYRQLVENTDTGLVVIDDKGIVISANEPYLRLAGAVRLEDVIGHSVTEWTAPEEKENNAQAVALCVSQGFIQDFETIYLHADGTRTDILINATVEGGPKGERRIASLCRNISERKRAEETLAQEQFLMQALMNNIPDYVYFKDRDSRFIRISKAHARSFGVSDPAQAIGKTDFDFFTKEHAQQAYDDEQAIIRTGQSMTKVERETWTDRPDTWASTTKMPLRDEEGNVIGTFGISRDITERKQAEDEVNRQFAENKILLKEVHHRIKNNIVSIGGLLSLHLKSVTNPEAVAVLQDAIGRVDSMRILYDKLLITEDYRDISVKNYVESLTDAVLALFPGSVKIKLEKHIDDFQLDPKRLFPLGIIINEILTNKMKYAFKGKVAGKIMISLDMIDQHVKLIVEDNGTGLPDDFDVNESKGFGLMLVKMLSQQLGGSFSMENSKGTPCKVEFDI